MAAKLLQTLADDNPDLQKQIGCMTGIFQLFDRHQMVSGRRYGHRRLLPANPHFGKAGIDREYDDANLQQHADEPSYFVHPSERQRFSTESSRHSISSSCSSSLSSLECSRSGQLESSPYDRAVSSEAPSVDPVPKQLRSSSPNVGRKSVDLLNVAKDSMYRESGRAGLQVKHMDSKKADGHMDVNNVPADIKESLKVLAELRESPWYYNDARQVPRSSSVRDQSSQSLAKDTPRFSYDGREQIHNHQSFESWETVKSSMKLKGFPRLPVDSGEGLDQPLHYVVNSCLVHKNSEKIGGISNGMRPPSIVGKLMGLEALPELSLASDNASAGLKEPELTETSRIFELSSHSGSSNSVGGSLKEPLSPRRRNPDGTIRPLPRIPNEPAPWRQSNGKRVLLKPGQKHANVPTKTMESVPSVYGEIEKRLKDLEFKQSGKDLRALKQILEAIQAKGLLESRKEDQDTNCGDDRNSRRLISEKERQQLMQGNHSIASGSRGLDDKRVFESPIVIMKPAKLVRKDGFVDSSATPTEDLSNLQEFLGDVPADTRKGVADQRLDRDEAPKMTRKNPAATSDKKIGSKNVKQNQIPSRPRAIPKETSSLPKKSSAATPRLHQRKLDLERHARPQTPPSDTSKSKRISNRQTSEAALHGVRHGIKCSSLNHSEDKISEVNIGSRTPGCQGNEASVHSDGSTFLSSKFEVEVSSRSLSAGSVQFSESKSMSMSLDISSPLVDEDEVFTECPTIVAEHHSPVSVLHPSVHIEDDLSPVKIMQNSLREVSALVLSRDGREEILGAKTDTVINPSTREVNRKKLQNIEKLVQKLRRVNSTHDEESTDYIASLCENTNPDHRYISEILLASGLLLRDLGSGPTTFQFYSSGQPINPELFTVLEQTKSSRITNGVQTKVSRRLIFDLVNEILSEKLTGSSVLGEPWLMSAGNLTRKTPTAQNLLKQLCVETDMLETKKPSWSSSSSSSSPSLKEDDCLKGILWEDVVHRTGSWMDFREETSSLVLGIERLIFKDLVKEILVGCGSGSRDKGPSRRRGLSSS